MAPNDFRVLADTLAEDIAAGRLRPGERLLPQREFAYQRGIAASTASRVYDELRRRGLISGEVGRGTFVRAAAATASPALVEPPSAPVDLELNFPILADQAAVMAPALAALMQPAALDGALRPVRTDATAGAREVAARFLAGSGFAPTAEDILFAGGGRQAIAATMAALAPPGARIGVEALSYPLVKGIAARLGITLVPLALDEAGVHPETIAQAHRSTPLNGLYLQPTLHNPLGVTMPRSRREEIAALLASTGLVAIEDAVYGFLADEVPLAAFAPGQVILIDSLSKRIAPGVTLGFIVAPHGLIGRVAGALRSGAWTPTGLALAAGIRLLSDGTAARIGADKREDAARRQAVARDSLAGLTLAADPRAYHLWLGLPAGWRAEAYAAAAARLGIAVTPAGAFSVGSGQAPNAVRLALAAPPLDQLAAALARLRRLAFADPADSGTE
jgi:DNA-binding transcriptional MocR family regulator